MNEEKPMKAIAKSIYPELNRAAHMIGLFAGSCVLALAQVASASNSVVAWGSGKCGQSGGANAGQSCVPKKDNNGYSAVAGGSAHSLALRAGKIVTWGADGWGETQ